MHNMSYQALHLWVKKRLPKPENCEWCLKSTRLVLANKTNDYLKSLDDWLWLCTKCHAQ